MNRVQFDGYKGDHVLVAPPYIVTSEEIVKIVDVLAEALDATVAQIRTRHSEIGL